VGGALRMLTSSALTSVVSATGLLEKLDASDRDANNQFTGPDSPLLLSAEIAVAHTDRNARNLRESLRELFGDSYRAVLAAGASDCDGRVAFVLALVALEHRYKRSGVCLEEFRCTLL